MYLDEILSSAVLKKDDQVEVVEVLPAGIFSWCDINMVVPRESWETIYVKYRASEPDVEFVLSAFLNNPSQELYREFGTKEVVRDRYQVLRTEREAEELDQVGPPPVEPQSMSEVVEEREDEEVSKTSTGFDNLPVDDDFMNPELHGEFENSDFRNSDVYCPELEENEVHKLEPESVRSPRPDLREEMDPQPAPVDEPKEFEVKLPEAPLQEIAALSAEAENSVQDPAVEPEKPFGLEALVQHQLQQDGQPEPDPEKDTEDSQPVVSESAQKIGELNDYLKFVYDRGEMPDLEKVAAWAQPCTALYFNLIEDFNAVFQTVDVEGLMQANGLSVEAFMEQWVDKSWGGEDAEFDWPHTPDGFKSLLLKSYDHALRMCVYMSEDSAVELTSLFSKLIYEE